LKSPSLSLVIPSALSVLALLSVGCAGPKVATDLLAEVPRQETPLASAPAAVEVSIDPGINNREGLDDTLKESLELALSNANVFGNDGATPYRIEAHILVASQSAMSFGNFEGKLGVHWVVHDPTGQQVLDEEIHTIAGADHWSFSGAARHRRARAVNIAKNVLQFVDLLVGRLQR